MSKKLLVLTLILVAAISACSGTSAPPEDNSDAIASQVAETVAAQDKATADVQNAINDMLTSSAPPPSETPMPATDTPTLGSPTETPEPTETSTPSPSPTIDQPNYSYIISSGDCKNETARIELRNNTRESATLNLVMEKAGRTCSYYVYSVGGSGYFWIEPGRYTYTANVCGYVGTFSGPLNSNWRFIFKEVWCN